MQILAKNIKYFFCNFIDYNVSEVINYNLSVSRRVISKMQSSQSLSCKKGAYKAHAMFQFTLVQYID